jgi:ribosomal protein S12 methylthiotransferase accessory factor
MYGYQTRFFDLRVTFSVPVVAAAAVRVDDGLGALCMGAGASIDPEAALSAALCEIATDSVNIRSRTKRDETRLRSLTTNFDEVLELHDHPLMYGIPEMASHANFLLGRPGEDRPVPSSMFDVYQRDRPAPTQSADLATDVQRCVADVTKAGFDVIVVDQTSPEQRDLDLWTVKVLVPGLLPIDFGWGRQRALTAPRLRTAHREAGLRPNDLEPEQFHRVPHPFP